METIFVGKERQYNRRFLQMCGHYLVEPVACTPASGWEKGQEAAVENQVGLVRERFFTPRLRFKKLRRVERLAARQMRRLGQSASPSRDCRQDDLRGFRGRATKTRPLRGCFDGFHAVSVAVSKTCLVRFDNSKYSVKARAVGRPVELHAYADCVVIRQDGIVVGEHRGRFSREETAYDPWHYVPVLARKPGASRNGAPFKDGVLPSAMEKIRRKLTGSADGDRQMVKILAAVLDDGLPAVEAACAAAMDQGVHSADVILNILARRRHDLTHHHDHRVVAEILGDGDQPHAILGQRIGLLDIYSAAQGAGSAVSALASVEARELGGNDGTYRHASDTLQH